MIDTRGVMMRRLFVGLLVLGAGLSPVGAHAGGSCASTHVGGDWPLYGHDLSNSRTSADTAENTTSVITMAAKWVFNIANVGGSGSVQTTPTVADGCVFVSTDGGDVVALNADDGSLVWHNQYVVGSVRLGGVISGAVAIDNGLALVNVTDAGQPYTVALDEFTGAEKWRTTIITRPGAFINASPVPFNGMVFVGFAGDEYSTEARGGYDILRESDGSILHQQFTISDADFNNGYWGGSVWATAAVDQATQFLFVGAGNPNSKTKEDPHTNAILKIDVNPSSGTFGEIVSSYKGLTDQYYPGLDQQPVCQADPNITYSNAWSASCAQLDLDFGSSPTLYKDSKGALRIGVQQKAGVFHSIDASTMTMDWSKPDGTPCFACSAASAANDNGTIVSAPSLPGQVVSLAGDDGSLRWLSPLVDIVHYNSVSIANGVAYVTDFYGNLNAFDEATGLPLFKRNMALDAGTNVNGTSSAGVSIARNNVYVGAAGFVIAYH
ncbi:MAG: outer membrane protein assembly factor BamB family protein [Actinomycetota bacterium]